MGIPVFNADDKAKSLYNRKDVLAAVARLFGAEIVDEHGNLRKQELASIVFRNPDELKKLNAMIHPLVAEEFQTWLSAQNAPYVIREAAILIESGSYKDCDHIILVSADVETRIDRVMKRSALSREEVLDRVNRQMNTEDVRQYADLEIHNDSGDQLIPQIWKIHSALTA